MLQIVKCKTIHVAFLQTSNFNLSCYSLSSSVAILIKKENRGAENLTPGFACKTTIFNLTHVLY
jgi:hypothetical protein